MQTGRTTSEISVIIGCRQSNKLNVPMRMTGSRTMTDVAPLTTVCNAPVSFMMREMRSPLRLSLKKPADKSEQMAEQFRPQIGDRADGRPLQKIGVQVAHHLGEQHDEGNGRHEQQHRQEMFPQTAAHADTGIVQPMLNKVRQPDNLFTGPPGRFKHQRGNQPDGDHEQRGQRGRPARRSKHRGTAAPDRAGQTARRCEETRSFESILPMMAKSESFVFNPNPSAGWPGNGHRGNCRLDSGQFARIRSTAGLSA